MHVNGISLSFTTIRQKMYKIYTQSLLEIAAYLLDEVKTRWRQLFLCISLGRFIHIETVYLQHACLGRTSVSKVLEYYDICTTCKFGLIHILTITIKELEGHLETPWSVTARPWGMVLLPRSQSSYLVQNGFNYSKRSLINN